MKLKRKIGIGMAVAAAIYCVLAYIFMWPPVVVQVNNSHLLFYRPRATYSANPCINNLRQVDAAINEFALEHNKRAGEPIAWTDLTPYIKLNSKGEIPGCHLGGEYCITVVGKKPTCSYIPNTTVRIGMFYYGRESLSHCLP